MKVAFIFAASFILLSSAFAQIDLREQVDGGPLPGIIDNFSFPAEAPRTWSSVDCNDAQVIEVVTEPDNASNMIGKFTSTACTDEGFEMDQEFWPFDFSLYTHFSLDVYAPEADRKIVFKIFNAEDPGNAKLVEAMTTRAAAWDTIHFDFSGTESGVYNRISIHPDFGETNEGEEWWFDNIRHTRGGPISIPNDGMLVDFDTIWPYMHWWDCNSLTAEYLVVDNPAKEGINPSEKCALMFTSDCQWEGFAIVDKFEPLDFSVTSEARVLVLAPAPNLQFMFKVEVWGQSGINVETTTLTSVGGEWEELIFDLSGIEAGIYTKVALFPDFLSELPDEEWYIDDVMITDPANVSVNENARRIKVFKLAASNYPNPYNPATTISYDVPLPSNVKVSVFDMRGRELEVLVDREHTPGEHTIQFDASNLASGVYLYKVESSYDVVVNKMVLMR